MSLLSVRRVVFALLLSALSACGGVVGPLEETEPVPPLHGTPQTIGVVTTPAERVQTQVGVHVRAPEQRLELEPEHWAMVRQPLQRTPPEEEVDAGVISEPEPLDAGAALDAAVAGSEPPPEPDEEDGGQDADIDAGAEIDPDAGAEVEPDDDDAGWSSDPDGGAVPDAGPSLPQPPQRTITWAASAAQVPQTKPAPGTFRIHLIDVGTGLALLVQGHDFTALFDGGSSDDLTGISNGASSNRLLAYLFAALGPSGPSECAPRGDTLSSPHVGGAELEIDYLFLSHAHQDHVSLLKDVLHCYRVKNVIEPGAAYTTQVYGDFVQKVAGESGTHYWTATPVPQNRTATLGTRTVPFGPDVSWSQLFEGDSMTLGALASFRILHATAAAASNVNETSLVVRMDLGRTSLLLMGDAESGTRADPSAPVSGVEAHLLAHWPQELDADLMQVAHHGSKTSSRLAFIQAVSPEVAMISSGPRKYGTVTLPDPEVVSAFVATGATLLRTDLNDAHCPHADRIGVDDLKSGGCDNWVIELGP